MIFFFFYFHYYSKWVKEDLLQFMLSVLPMFSSKSFTVSGLVFKSLIHFEFIFVNGVKKYSKFILLHVVVQFSRHHLLGRGCFFSIVYFCLLCQQQKKIPIGTWVYIWAFYLVPLVYISVFVPVPYCLDECSFVVSSESQEG